VPKIEVVFSTICWVIAAYFAWAALSPFNAPPNITENGHYVFLLLAVFFFVIPVAQKVEIFKFLTFESRLGEIKAKQAEHAEEIKQLQVLQFSLSNSLTSVVKNNNQASVHIYQSAPEVIEAAEEGLRKKATAAQGQTKTSPPSQNAFDSEIPGDEQNDNPFARAIRNSGNLQQILLSMNVELQVALRTALGKSLQIYQQRKSAKYLTASQLWQKFIQLYPDQSPLAPSFLYFFNVSNAAAHGQQISDNDLQAALGIGERLIAEVAAVRSN
jgi:TolA-binding protein